MAAKFYEVWVVEEIRIDLIHLFLFLMGPQDVIFGSVILAKLLVTQLAPVKNNDPSFFLAKYV